MSEEQTQAQTQAPELTVPDLQNLRTLLDVATRRGAFGAAEMTSVGAVFDRLNNFLNAITPPQQPAEETPSEQPAGE